MGSNHPKACQLYLQNLFLNICANTLAATVLNTDFSHINFILVKEHNIILGTFFFMKGWGRGSVFKEKHPWIKHIWDVGWCPPKQPHLQACISDSAPGARNPTLGRAAWSRQKVCLGVNQTGP